MRGDGVGDIRTFFLVERVVTADHPLQLGEFADHPAHQIGLGQNGGALGIVRLGADQRRDLASQQPHPLHALILAAELVVEDDLLQLRHPGFEAHIAVLVEEELGVGQPRGNHPFAAGDDGLAAVLRRQIGN